MAKLAEQAERYDEMVDCMNQVATMGLELTTEERNLLSVAYKNVIGARRASWRILSSVESKVADEDSMKEELIKSYKGKVEKELQEKSMNIIDLLDNHLFPQAMSAESKTFYLKMKGDYYRYLAEFQTGPGRDTPAAKSLEAYDQAAQIAEELPSTHAIRLGLALNFSVFYYEILNSPDKACKLARKAFDEALKQLETLGEDNYKDSTLILQLLRDNLTLWSGDKRGDEEENAPEDELQDVESCEAEAQELEK